jgi:hypothetical protein
LEFNIASASAATANTYFFVTADATYKQIHFSAAMYIQSQPSSAQVFIGEVAHFSLSSVFGDSIPAEFDIHVDRIAFGYLSDGFIPPIDILYQKYPYLSQVEPIRGGKAYVGAVDLSHLPLLELFGLTSEECTMALLALYSDDVKSVA